LKYLEWNNIISGELFNQKNEGKDIYLYLTRQDIIHIGRKQGDKTDDEIWDDFVLSIKNGLPGSQGTLVQKAKYCYDKRKLNSIDAIELKFPPYITYLIFLIQPLIEDIDGTFGVNNYYDRLNTMLRQYSISQTLGTPDFRDNKINLLWQDLEYWANTKNNGELGKFKVLPFKNSNWIYVGKFFSQCIFPPLSLKRLPDLFLEAGMAPNLTYNKDEFRSMLLKYGTAILSLKQSVVDLIKRSHSNELGQSIIEIVIREYKKWNGETHEDEEDQVSQRTKRNYTVAPLFLQFKLNQNDGIISFSFRLYSLNDYPEDLKFGCYDNLYEINGWSKTLNFDFEDSFDLKDDFNKWIARFPNRDVRLFVNAGIHQLSRSYWIETETLSRFDPMYLLCKKERLKAILQWSKSFEYGCFTKEQVEGIPGEYSLFKIRNPTRSCPDIPLLTLYTEKTISIVDGLKVNFRTFINDFLPDVQISNSNGNEKVYLQYKNKKGKTLLNQKQSKSNLWLLPQNVLLNTDFYIKVEEENFMGNEIAYKITSSDNSATSINEVELPKRDSFGKTLKSASISYCLGSNIVNPGKASQKFYSPWASFFIPNREDEPGEFNATVFFNHAANMLSSYVTEKAVLTTEDFYQAFEFYFSREFHERQIRANFNLVRAKRSALNFYDYTGILDFDYEAKKIVVNPPQLIFIPSNKGRKVLLIGGRDKGLITNIIDKGTKYDLEIQIKKQFTSNAFLLLPDVITITSFSTRGRGSWERNLMEFANELNINFSKDYFPQIAMQEFSANIEDYENSLELTDENDYGWARKIFSPDSLRYERSENQNFDKSFSLIEYKLNEYTYYNKLWKEGKCFSIDKNWGRYLALKHYRKSVILIDAKRKRVAIPIEAPLPRLLTESMMLFSGYAPDILVIDARYYRVYENIPSNITRNIFAKLGQWPIEIDLQ
jgi:hypothetical protein